MRTISLMRINSFYHWSANIKNLLQIVGFCLLEIFPFLEMYFFLNFHLGSKVYFLKSSEMMQMVKWLLIYT